MSVWPYYVVGGIGAIGLILFAMGRLLKQGNATYDILQFSVFTNKDLMNLIDSDRQSIKDGKKKAVLIYGVRGDESENHAINEIRKVIWQSAPETHEMEDFFVFAVLDTDLENLNNLKFHIIKFDTLEESLHEKLSQTPLFKDGAMVIGETAKEVRNV